MTWASGRERWGVAVLLLAAAGGVRAQSAAMTPAPAETQVPVISPLDGHEAPPNAPQPQVQHAEETNAEPQREGVTGLRPDFLGFLGPYRTPTVPPLFDGNAARMDGLIREGKLYLTLQDAIALALENNLDVETERYNLTLARTDVVRAAGGGSTRGIDYSVLLPQNGVGGPGSPLLNATTASSNPSTPTVTDLTALNATTQTQQSLAETTTGTTYSVGPNVPLFDPQLIGDAGYLRRSDTAELGSSSTGSGAGSTSGGGLAALANAGAVDFLAANVAYVQGFSTGLELEAVANNAATVDFGTKSKADPFSTPSTSVTLTQPLLRGFGRGVNLRYLRIARTDEKISRLVFEQQVMATIYGTSRLYFDLVSLGEDVQVKAESLRAASKQREDDENQEKMGTLAPIQLTQAKALESSARFALIQAQGLYKQQEIILRNELLRTASPVFTAQFDEIVPTDRIVVPEQMEALDVPALVAEGLSQRPDLAQAELQVEAGKISVQASRNNARPQLNVYANAETRGSSEQPYETLGSPGTGLATTPQELGAGGFLVSKIFQAGVQLTLPLRNRVAEADAARDSVQLRQVQARTEKVAQQIREDVETAVVALQTAQAAYVAASESREYQAQLLDAERDKLTVGQSTELAVLQNQAYLAQAKSTEIAARSNWMKARISLDYALGDLLEKNHVELEDAIRGTMR